jgi:small subunit ribosomal protein S2
MSDISLAQLLEAGVHFGHKAYRWNPKMFPYIYTERNNIHILDLIQSAQLLKEANLYVKLAAEKKKNIFIYRNKTSSKCFNCSRSKTK